MTMRQILANAPRRTSTVKIIELPDGEGNDRWLLAWDAETFEKHGSGVEALRAVQERDRILAEAGICCFTVIEWDPKTAAGRAVVRVLTQG